MDKTKKGELTMYSPDASHALRTYGTDNLIVEASNEIFHFTQPMNSTPVLFPGTLWMQILCILQVSDDYVLKGTFINRLAISIQRGISTCWRRHKDATLRKLTYEAASLQTLQAALTSLEHVANRQFKQ